MEIEARNKVDEKRLSCTQERPVVIRYLIHSLRLYDFYGERGRKQEGTKACCPMFYIDLIDHQKQTHVKKNESNRQVWLTKLRRREEGMETATA